MATVAQVEQTRAVIRLLAICLVGSALAAPGWLETAPGAPANCPDTDALRASAVALHVAIIVDPRRALPPEEPPVPTQTEIRAGASWPRTGGSAR